MSLKGDALRLEYYSAEAATETRAMMEQAAAAEKKSGGVNVKLWLRVVAVVEVPLSAKFKPNSRTA